MPAAGRFVTRRARFVTAICSRVVVRRKRRPMKRCLRHACGLVFSSLLAALPVHAVQWLGSSGDAFNTGSLWNGGSVPGSSSTAEFSGALGTIRVTRTHAVGTFHFTSGFASGGFLIRDGGSLTLASGIVNDSAAVPIFTIQDGVVFFTGEAPNLGNANFTVQSAGTLKLFTENNPNGSGARVNLTGGRVTHDNPVDAGTASLGEVKGTSGSIILGHAALTVGALGTDATYAGAIESTASLTKVGTGTWTLTGANNYTGPTLISAGAIKIGNASGSVFGTSDVTIGSGGTLTGAGSFTGSLVNEGLYAPGNSPALTTLSSFSQEATGILELEIASLTRGTGYDALNVTGLLEFGGTLRLLLLDGFTPEAGQSFDLFDASTMTGTFSTLDLPTLMTGLAWDTSGLYTSGTLAIAAASAIPEPTTYAAIFGGVALLLAVRRRHQLANPR